MRTHLFDRVRHLARAAISLVRSHLLRCTRPATAGSLVIGAAADLVRSRSELVAENALLRQQLIVLARTAKRPRFSRVDRPLLVLLASRVRAWRQTLLIVQPETLLRWHRAGFRLVWRWRSAPRRRQSIAPDTIALIERMARENRLWGAERIRGELAKLGIRASKRTIQKYLRRTRPRRPAGQSWRTFLRNHAGETWACDFLQLTDLLFRPVFAFFILELGSRRVVHVGVTRSPTESWTAQQLREATPDGSGPRFLIHDHDAKYGPAFDRVAATSAIELVRTPVRAPRATAVCERFLGSVRRECVDHTLVLGERQLGRILAEYVAYFNAARPHQGIDQRTPASSGTASPQRPSAVVHGVIGVPVLGGLHHEYRRVA
ncbi:MAG TPA: integrase core domain-containing protein [Chloroflexota bacterium]